MFCICFAVAWLYIKKCQQIMRQLAEKICIFFFLYLKLGMGLPSPATPGRGKTECILLKKIFIL